MGIPIHKKISPILKYQISNFGLQVQPVDGDEKAVWDCYQTTDDCSYDNPEGCDAWNIADGFIGADRVRRSITKIGTEK